LQRFSPNLSKDLLQGENLSATLPLIQATATIDWSATLHSSSAKEDEILFMH
jgi:hypothetical protein